jgi:aminomethyltransferase
MEESEPKKTALYDIHKSLGAKIVPFAGFLMPVQYRGIIAEHKRVRTTVGIFDVSHMGEFEFRGPDAEKFLNRITINNVSKLEIGQVQYSAMCYPDGGIVDDLLTYRFDDHYVLVVNAANLIKDREWIQQHLPEQGVDFDDISDDITLIAVQGPKSRALLQKISSLDLSPIPYYHFTVGQIAGIDVVISRTGYTGELGFEIYVSRTHSEELWNALFEAGKSYDVEPVGLGARDTLRMEMKYCLYGNDIDHTTNPLEAGLGWITRLKKGYFIGRDALLTENERGCKRELIGFECLDKAIPRKGYSILKDNLSVGITTSGAHSPMLNKGIGLGYVAKNHSSIGTELQLEIRGKEHSIMIVETPFYKPAKPHVD